MNPRANPSISIGTRHSAGGVGGLLMANLSDGNGTTQTVYYGYDGNGNVITLADTSGNIVANYDYDPFGNLVRMNGEWAVFNPIRFSTKYALDNATYAGRDTGLIYYGRRFYNVALGRFNNRDPIGEAGGVNLYAMCRNDLVGRIDYIGFHTFMGAPNESIYWSNLIHDAEHDCKCNELLAAIEARKTVLRNYLKSKNPYSQSPYIEGQMQYEALKKGVEYAINSKEESEPYISLTEKLASAPLLSQTAEKASSVFTGIAYAGGVANIIAGAQDTLNGLNTGSDKIINGVVQINETAAYQVADKLLEIGAEKATSSLLGSAARVVGERVVAGKLIVDQAATTANAWLDAADSELDQQYNDELNIYLANEYRLLEIVVRRSNAICGH